ncbi:hypothetical protein PR048_013410 [Dryococelus australis]|uniref:Uncharacterized protein n=1 Tax=Dryococelus australis TaxID=614101 RepID=A0ABQ9HSE3_9NEOP|nr:hypothetical protein PR048_013410 [Dryococelus australis]
MNKAACALHNWLRNTSPNSYTPPGSVDYEDTVNITVVTGLWRAQITQLRSIQRSRITNRPTKISQKLRDSNKAHFSGDWAIEWQARMNAWIHVFSWENFGLN